MMQMLLKIWHISHGADQATTQPMYATITKLLTQLSPTKLSNLKLLIAALEIGLCLSLQTLDMSLAILYTKVDTAMVEYFPTSMLLKLIILALAG
jgi:hypothetical protein